MNVRLTVRAIKVIPMPSPDMSMKNMIFMKQWDVRCITTTMTQEQKLLADISCCVIMVDKSNYFHFFVVIH